MLVVVGKNARRHDPQGVGWLEKVVREGLGRDVLVSEDPERAWYAELQGCEKAKPVSITTSLILSPSAWAGYLGHFLGFKNVEGMNLKGEGRYLGGVFLIDAEGNELWRYKEPGLAQYCGKEELEDALKKASS